MKPVRIYTDGGCSNNQSKENVGGYGAILEYGDYRKEIFGGEKNTTNNRMEMTALLEALNALKKENLTLEIFSDSSYLMDCFRKKWYENWQKNGWKTAGKKPVENRDLWEALLAHLDRHRSFSFYRVKGHVNLNSEKTNFEALYQKFVEWNGVGFSFEDFRYVTQMNNRADELAGLGIRQIQESDQIQETAAEEAQANKALEEPGEKAPK